MSDRQAAPPQQGLKTFARATSEAVQTLQRRPFGAPNGLIVPGGGAGTWTALSGYAGTWTATNVVGQQSPQYTLDADGFVHLRGHIRNTANFTPGSIGIVLPVGYRPTAVETFIVGVSGGALGFAMLQTLANGGIDFDTSSVAWNAVNWVSLSGVSFYVGGQ